MFLEVVEPRVGRLVAAVDADLHREPQRHRLRTLPPAVDPHEAVAVGVRRDGVRADGYLGTAAPGGHAERERERRRPGRLDADPHLLLERIGGRTDQAYRDTIADLELTVHGP